MKRAKKVLVDTVVTAATPAPRAKRGRLVPPAQLVSPLFVAELSYGLLLCVASLISVVSMMHPGMKGDQGEQGETGEQGPAGAKGDEGPRGYVGKSDLFFDYGENRADRAQHMHLFIVFTYAYVCGRCKGSKGRSRLPWIQRPTGP